MNYPAASSEVSNPRPPFTSLWLAGGLKNIERPDGRGLVRRVYGGLVCLLPAFYQPLAGWLVGWLAGRNDEKWYFSTF